MSLLDHVSSQDFVANLAGDPFLALVSHVVVQPFFLLEPATAFAFERTIVARGIVLGFWILRAIVLYMYGQVLRPVAVLVAMFADVRRLV